MLRSSRALTLVTALASVLALPGHAAAVQLITLHSGNGPGPTDALITFLEGPNDAPFDHAFTAADFAAASGGPAAPFTLVNPAWSPTLPSDPTAVWIATHPEAGLAGTPPHNQAFGRTGLFAIPFTVTEATVDRALLDFRFLVDNQLGDPLNQGLFINGQPVPMTKLLGINSSYFNVEQRFRRDVSSLLTTGANTLYVNQVDFGFGAGINFAATITVPEPAPILLLALGAGCVGWRQRGRLLRLRVVGDGERYGTPLQ